MGRAGVWHDGSLDLRQCDGVPDDYEVRKLQIVGGETEPSFDANTFAFELDVFLADIHELDDASIDVAHCPLDFQQLRAAEQIVDASCRVNAGFALDEAAAAVERMWVDQMGVWASGGLEAHRMTFFGSTQARLDGVVQDSRGLYVTCRITVST